MKKLAIPFLSGLLFAAGLGLSGMTQPQKVVAFLDFLGAWDPSLMFVMGGAAGVHAFFVLLARRRSGPLLGDRFHWPDRRDIDAPLVAGAALFGLGWGLAGYCPGPALQSSVTGSRGVLVFVVAMLAGMGLHALLGRVRVTSPSPETVRSDG